MSRMLVVAVALIFSGCDQVPVPQRAPRPMSYVKFATAVSAEHCDGAGMDKWVESQPTSQAKLQASSTCTAYQIGKRDAYKEMQDEQLKELEENSQPSAPTGYLKIT